MPKDLSLLFLRRRYERVVKRIVEVHHPKAAIPLAQLFLDSLTVSDFANLPDPDDFFTAFLDQDHLPPHTWDLIVQKLNSAVVDYVHYLETNRLDDLKVTWPVSLQIDPPAQLSWLRGYAGEFPPEEAKAMQAAWDLRYTAEPFDPSTGCAGFSVVCRKSVVTWFESQCPHWNVCFEENIEPALRPDVSLAPTSEALRAAHITRCEALFRQKMGNYVPMDLTRGDDPWYPFPRPGHTRRPNSDKPARPLVAVVTKSKEARQTVQDAKIDAKVSRITSTWRPVFETKARAQQYLKEWNKRFKSRRPAPPPALPVAKPEDPQEGSWASTACSGESLPIEASFKTAQEMMRNRAKSAAGLGTPIPGRGAPEEVSVSYGVKLGSKPCDSGFMEAYVGSRLGRIEEA
ncbi:uncharacterized protein BDZ99DRAFT_572443 [Mytilinidion resinicola]|uniref:Uncharacterized protein n=1 Tax=Mytilinidion resinicola TaxID=574789 RepID=A0A6A6YJ77_9PEZI|nr:uncharacterized protein BDZ99DRAFT_572443 [Mytilinidion resinicola]KAF2808608.1 hypothetical protein BDZ99DRAFT_572443 [Mytilinidion resinicola]